MRVLWFTSRPIIGTCGEDKPTGSGSWLDAAYDSCKDIPGLELHIVSLSVITKRVTEKRDGHYFYLLPDSKESWIFLKGNVLPDVVQVWGTEHDKFLPAFDVYRDVPKVVYIQGVAAKIAREYDLGISSSEKRRYLTIQDVYRHSWFDAVKKDFTKRAEVESRMLRASDAVIVENDWCADQVSAIAPGIEVYRSKLPIKSEFFQQQWALSKVERRSIFTNAGGHPFKGHHILFRALAIIAKRYPDVKLYVPGFSRMGGGFKNWTRRKGYENMLQHIISDDNLDKNIVYVGALTAEQMAEHLSKCNAYVMPSCVENHSSSLIEAMIVGAPSVSSFVGGVGAIAQNGYNALLYNYSDPESIAGNVLRIFEDDELAQRLSDNCEHLRKDRLDICIGDEFSVIYNKLTGR